MERKPVKSGNIASVGYDEENKILEIEFHSGGIYQYEPITASGYRDFINAPSLGTYFSRFIKNNNNISFKQV